MSSVRYEVSCVEHRAEHPVGPGQRTHRGDQLVAHAGHQKPPESARAVGDTERGVARTDQLGRGIHEVLQHLVHRQVRGHPQDRVADRLEGRIEPLATGPDIRPRRDSPLPLAVMPRHWIWMQVVIVVFVLAGMVIAITKLV